MFGSLGGSEIFLILVIGLIVFGPRKLPEIGKSVGKMLGEFRRASADFKQTIESEVEAEKIRNMTLDALKDEPPPTVPPPAAAPSESAAKPAESASADLAAEARPPDGETVSRGDQAPVSAPATLKDDV